ncbi:MAG TPA: SDR family oxidoreductase, partial [Steroidobacteraceae bacterium]|nr:SDR family oxidoreductase [Steroidobacteraceae bacterium]
RPGASMDSFKDKVVVVTGASEGIGRALALSLAGAEARLVLAARNAERLVSLSDECAARGATALTVPTDVTLRADCDALVEAALTRFGVIDVLLHNAGSTMWSRLDELEDPELLERLMRTNYLGAAWLTWKALPALAARRGRIVAVASLAGLVGVPTRTGYAASKHAMIGFFDSLRIELAGSGVSVTVVAPDFVRSEIHRRAIGPDGRPLGTSPMQETEIMTADECAAIILDATLRRRRLVITSLRGRALRWLKLLAPALVDRLADRAIRRRS